MPGSGPVSRSVRRYSGEWCVDAQPLSWIRNGTWRDRPVLVLAHGAGASMRSPFMDHVASCLGTAGITVVRFNFPYMERAEREGRRRPPDPAKRLVATCRAVLERVRAALPAKQRAHPPIVVGGKSMGGRMFSLCLADDEPPDVRGAVYLGYPLHPPGKPDRLRRDHLERVRVPQLFVSGDRDPLARWEALEPTVRSLPRARLHRVAGGDHSLARQRQDPFAGSDAWTRAITVFVRRQVPEYSSDT